MAQWEENLLAQEMPCLNILLEDGASSPSYMKTPRSKNCLPHVVSSAAGLFLPGLLDALLACVERAFPFGLVRHILVGFRFCNNTISPVPIG